MKILVFGAGVTGTLHAWALERAGHAVSLLVRPGDDVSDNPLTLEVLDTRAGQPEAIKTVFLPNRVRSLSPQDRYDLVIDAVPYSQLEETLPALAASLGDAILLFFNSNWRGLNLLDRHLTKGQYVLGMPRSEGELANGILQGSLERQVVLGSSTCGRRLTAPLAEAASKNLDRVVTLFQEAGFATEIHVDMEQWYWVHFATLAVWAGAAAKTGDLTRLVQDVTAVREALLAGREAMDVCKARGADISRCSDAQPFLVSQGPKSAWMQRFIGGDLRRRVPPVRGEQAREYRRFYDEVIQTARRLHVPTPHLDAYRPYVDQIGSRLSRPVRAPDPSLVSHPG